MCWAFELTVLPLTSCMLQACDLQPSASILWTENGLQRSLLLPDNVQRTHALQVPVVFFSLLRKGTPDRDRSEAKLAEAFDFLAGQLRSLHKLPVSYVALDWHQMDKELGSEALVEGFWAQLSSLLPSQVRLSNSHLVA